ncbi:multiple sugar transport system substrate-binding protein [Paenibacillus tianmuensis]|uniref:Multiple sugar transport system substrate-binding protein n=1 Tax=Paenibacillus tianmuensis TaxID=624147 RepID=A0A1G4SRH4_9BACL|nr:extracellular solute-binding protein [Paenibacillus tianmuensis]SCW71802.1 multiple sugar transport system substrate-binding protein [Paenibacillus tianmuensis]
MTKRVLSMMLPAALSLGILLSGCGSDSGSPNNAAAPGGAGDKVAGEITIWGHPYVSDNKKEQLKAFWNDTIAAFKQKYPDVKVNYEEIPWKGRGQKILTALAAGSGPDVFYQLPDQVPQFAGNQALEPLDAYVKDINTDDFSKGALAGATYQGKLYALPILQEVQTLIYNPDLIKAIGEDPAKLPTTWDEFDRWAEKAKAKGLYARNFEGGAGCCNATLYPLLWQSGGNVLDDGGSMILNNDKGVQVFDNGWIPKDSISSDDQFPEFLSGKMLAVWGQGSTLTTLKAQKKPYVIGPPLKKEKQASFGTVGMFVVSKASKNKAAAVEFAKFLTNTDTAKAFNKLTGYLPVRKSAGDIYNDDQDMKEFM